MLKHAKSRIYMGSHATGVTPGDPGYIPSDDSSVGKADLHPFCLAVVPLPIKPTAAPAPSRSGDVVVPSTSRYSCLPLFLFTHLFFFAPVFSKKVPKPKVIRTPQAPKEPCKLRALLNDFLGLMLGP